MTMPTQAAIDEWTRRYTDASRRHRDFTEGKRKPLPFAPTLHLFHCFCGQELTAAASGLIECPTCARQWAPAQPSMDGAA